MMKSVYSESDITLADAIRAFADHIEIPYAPNVPQLIRSLLVIFEKSTLQTDRQVVLDMFNMIFRHYLKYHLYMVNQYDQEYTNYFFDKVRSKIKNHPGVNTVILDFLKFTRDQANISKITPLSPPKKINRSHLFHMIPNEQYNTSNTENDKSSIEQENYKFLITNEEDSDAESYENSDNEEETKQTKQTFNKKSLNNGSSNRSKDNKKGGKLAEKRHSNELQQKSLKRHYETPFRDKFTLGEESTKTTMIIMEAFELVKEYLNKYSQSKIEDDRLLICEWSIDTISEMYEEASTSYETLEECISYEKWQNMFKVIRSCPYFEVIENIFEKFLFSSLDPQDISTAIIKHSASRSWVVSYMNYCLWNQIVCVDFDMSLSNHFSILEQDCQDDSGTNCGFSRVRILLHIMKYISDDEPDMIISSCISNVPIFLNLLGTSRELLNCYMSQLDVLNDNILQFIFEYPNSEEVILRMFDILRFSQTGFQIEMLQDHIEALLDSLISICEDFNRCFSGILVEKSSNCYRLIQNIGPKFIASLVAYKDSEKNTILKMNFVRALCSGNVNNLRCNFKAELLTLFLQMAIHSTLSQHSQLYIRNEAFENLFDSLTNCYSSENIVEIIGKIFSDLVKIHDVNSRQMALNCFVSFLISKEFCKKSLYNHIVSNFSHIRNDSICIYHNLRILDHWSERYFRLILPDHKDYTVIYPTLMETYFNVVARIAEESMHKSTQYSKVYLNILRQILKYFGRFSGFRHCNNQIAMSFVISCFKSCSTIPSSGSGYVQIGFLMELLKKITADPEAEQEQLRNLSDHFVKALQTHFVTKKIGLYIVPQVENELKLLEFFKENEFFMAIFEYFSKKQALRWFHHILKGLLSASISDLQSSRSMSDDYVNCGVALFEMFSNGEYFSRAFLRLISHMQDFSTFSRAEQATMLEEVHRVFARYGAEINLHWKTDFFRNHFSQCRLLISSKLNNSEEILTEIEQWSN